MEVNNSVMNMLTYTMLICIHKISAADVTIMMFKPVQQCCVVIPEYNKTAFNRRYHTT